MKIIKPAKDSRHHSRDFTNNQKASSTQSATVQKSSAEGEHLQAQQSPLQMAELEEENEVQMKKSPLQFVAEEEEVQMKKGPLQFVAEQEDELQMKKAPLQFVAEEEELQMKKGPLQFAAEPEEELQMKKGPLQMAKEEEGELQMKKASESPATNLPENVQGKMESAFNADFSNVQIHQGEKASAVGALAYTQGNEIHFGPGQYNPDSSKGQELIGHELTHVVQQRQGRVTPTTAALGVPVNDSPSLEQEADTMGRQAVQMKEGDTAEQPKQEDEGFKVDQKEFFEKATKIASSIPGSNSMCSHGTRQLFEQLTGSKELYSVVNPKEYAVDYSDAEGKVEGTQANNQADYLAKSKNFTEVSFDEAVAAVKSGGLVISVWKNPEWLGKGDTGHSGHLNILMPEYYSGNWNKEKKAELPRAFDTGVGKRWPTTERDANKQTLNYTYGNDKHKDVKFYKYTPQKSQPVTQ